VESLDGFSYCCSLAAKQKDLVPASYTQTLMHLKKREHLGTSPHWSWLGKYELSQLTALCYPK